MDDLLMPAPPGEMPPPPGASGMGGGMPPPPPPGMGGDMPGGMPPMPPEMDPQNMALAAAEVTMEMLPTMPDQALSALSSSVMAEVDRRTNAAGGGPEMPAGGGMGMGMPPMPGAGAPPPPMPGAGAGAPPPPPPGGIGALIG